MDDTSAGRKRKRQAAETQQTPRTAVCTRLQPTQHVDEPSTPPYTTTVSTTSSLRHTQAPRCSLHSLSTSLLSVLSSYLNYFTLLPLSRVSRQLYFAVFHSDECWRYHPLVKLMWANWSRSLVRIDGCVHPLQRPPASFGLSTSTSSSSFSSSERSLCCLSSLRYVHQVEVDYRLGPVNQFFPPLQESDVRAAAGAMSQQLQPLREQSSVRELRIRGAQRQMVVAELANCCRGMRWLRALEVGLSGRLQDASVAELAAILQPLCTPALVHLSVLTTVAAAMGRAGCLGSLQSLHLTRDADLQWLRGETSADYRNVERYCDCVMLPAVTHLNIAGASSLHLPSLLEQQGDQLTFLSLSPSETALPASSLSVTVSVASPAYSALQSLHLDRVTLPAASLQWLGLFPSLTQLSLKSLQFHERSDNASSLLAAAELPVSLHYLKLAFTVVYQADEVDYVFPNAADVDYLLSPHHSRLSFSAALTHLWLAVSASEVEQVSALSPCLPDLYPHRSHCHVLYRQNTPAAVRAKYECAWTALRERLGAIWCTDAEQFEQVRLDKQWRRAQIVR